MLRTTARGIGNLLRRTLPNYMTSANAAEYDNQVARKKPTNVSSKEWKIFYHERTWVAGICDKLSITLLARICLLMPVLWSWVSRLVADWMILHWPFAGWRRAARSVQTMRRQCGHTLCARYVQLWRNWAYQRWRNCVIISRNWHCNQFLTCRLELLEFYENRLFFN